MNIYLWTVDAAKIAGISTRQFRRIAHTLKFFKINRKMYVLRSEFDQWKEKYDAAKV